ncbi:MAG: phage holin family protein [Thermoflexaceae bacterium]|nr:phage holin family protein [Thermoflexaceae bacterium]
MAFVIRWLITAAAVWVAAAIVGGIELEGWRSTLLVALILGLLNAVLKPLLFWVSLPITVLTLGVFYLVLNAAMLGLTAWIAGKFESIHFAVDGFWSAFWGAVIISVVSWFIGLVVNPKRIARDLAR